MAYIERRRRRLFAVHEIPADVRAHFDGRRYFFKALGTEVMEDAKRRLPILEAGWRADIAKARRGGTKDPLEGDAAFWRGTLQGAPEEQRGAILDHIADEAASREDRAARAAGIEDPQDPALDALPGVQQARRFHALATGKLVRTLDRLDDWAATLAGLEPKTVGMRKAAVRTFAETFPYLQEVERKAVQRWASGLILQRSKSRATVQRLVSDLRGYWRWLAAEEVVAEEPVPFDKLDLPKDPKVPGREDTTRRPFDAPEVVRLHTAALAKGDQQLADLIALGMWTGARIESLCALKAEDVKEDEGSFLIREDKTEAGRRVVPIHSKLAPVVARLKEGSKDGYLMSGLKPNKYGDRSAAMSKRFGRLKEDQGFGPALVFHSLRKTVATLLENAGVPENVSADILGHEKKTMTYGLYSGGSSLALKREAIERLAYPEPETGAGESAPSDPA